MAESPVARILLAIWPTSRRIAHVAPSEPWVECVEILHVDDVQLGTPQPVRVRANQGHADSYGSGVTPRSLAQAL